MTNNIQLSDYNKCNISCLRFGKVESKTIPIGKRQIGYKRIPILTKYKNGKDGPLLFTTERLFSFGVQETERNWKSREL